MNPRNNIVVLFRVLETNKTGTMKDYRAVIKVYELYAKHQATLYSKLTHESSL